MEHQNLFAGPPATYLPEDPAAAELAAGADPAAVAAAHPASLAAWAALAERALDRGEWVTAYAYARTGYHRGLDQLRRLGLDGSRPDPLGARAEPGLPALAARAGPGRGAIGEQDEERRCQEFLHDSSPAAAAALAPG